MRLRKRTALRKATNFYKNLPEQEEPIPIASGMCGTSIRLAGDKGEPNRASLNQIAPCGNAVLNANHRIFYGPASALAGAGQELCPGNRKLPNIVILIKNV